MKITSILLTMVACVAISASVKADSLEAKTGSSRRPLTSVASAPRRGTVYITSVAVTGSHLPLVVRRYRGQVDSMSPTASYGKPQLDQTGQLNVGAELAQRDPAITIGHR